MVAPWPRAIFLVIACAVGSLSARAATAPLPAVPQIVAELYLPEEQEAARAAYALYAAQPEEAREELRRSGRLPLASTQLGEPDRGALAAWFNSARWGCDPPAEKLDAEAIAKSAVALTEEGGVVGLALQSPEKRISRTLAIACAPAKAAWVRDGVPLLPAWVATAWPGGTKPPKPSAAHVTRWQWMQWLYRCYAELPAPLLRDLHRKGTLRVSIGDVSDGARAALASVIDDYQRGRNEQQGREADYGRPADARERVFGVKEIVFRYSRSHPDCMYNFPFGNSLYECPPAYRQIYLTANPSYPLPPQDWFIGRDDQTGRPALSLTFLVAMEAPLQREVVRWLADCDAWDRKWQYEEGGTQRIGEGAPPYPTLH